MRKLLVNEMCCLILSVACILPAFGQNSEAITSSSLPLTGSIESRFGALAFEGGYPTDATVAKLYDEMDFQRAAQAYQWAIPLILFAKLTADPFTTCQALVVAKNGITSFRP